MDVGSNPVNTVFVVVFFSFFFLEFFSSQLVFNVSYICIETFFPLFPVL